MRFEILVEFNPEQVLDFNETESVSTIAETLANLKLSAAGLTRTYDTDWWPWMWVETSWIDAIQTRLKESGFLNGNRGFRSLFLE